MIAILFEITFKHWHIYSDLIKVISISVFLAKLVNLWDVQGDVLGEAAVACLKMIRKCV